MNISDLIFGKTQIRLFWPIILVLLLVIFGEFLIVDPFGLLLGRLGLPAGSGIVEHEWSTAMHDILKRSIRSIVVIISLYLPVRYLLKQPFQYLGFIFRDKWLSQLGIGILFGFIVQIIPLFIMGVLGWYSIEGWIWEFKPLSVLTPAILFSLFYSFETGIIEESLFRGFLMNVLARRFNIKVGLITSSLVFGLMHFSSAGNEFPWWLSLISATIAGVIFGQAYMFCGNIWVPLGLHAAIHFSARILGSDGASPDEATLLVTSVDGPILWVVTKAGGASLLELIGYFTISFLMYQLNKRKINHAVAC